MNAKELRELSKQDIEDKLIELRKELIKENAQVATGTTPKSPGQMKQMKKTIARILTINTEKEKTKTPVTKESKKPKDKAESKKDAKVDSKKN